MIKAMREAKLRTSWTDPDAGFEGMMLAEVEKLLADDDFVSDFSMFHEPIARCGEINSLAQTLLKLTAPGVPDTYQGTELPDFSLVDPDNRRPVDYECRRIALDEGSHPKQRIHHELLRLRQKHPKLFTEAAYEPLFAVGEAAEHVFAFRRRFEGQQAIVVVPRLTFKLRGWGNTALSLSRPMNSIIDGSYVPGGQVQIQELFKKHPVALLMD